MKHPNKVLASYACAAIERFFFVKTPDQRPVITKATISNYVVNILSPLCNLLDTQQNLYGIKAFYRVIQTSGDAIIPYADTLIKMLDTYLQAIILHPENQTYNYMLFECASITINIIKNTDVLKLYEQTISPSLMSIISKNIPELISYAFQILSMLVLHMSDLNTNYQVIYFLNIAFNDKHCGI